MTSTRRQLTLNVLQIPKNGVEVWETLFEVNQIGVFMTKSVKKIEDFSFFV